jgi:hypothetical protein
VPNHFGLSASKGFLACGHASLLSKTSAPNWFGFGNRHADMLFIIRASQPEQTLLQFCLHALQGCVQDGNRNRQANSHEQVFDTLGAILGRPNSQIRIHGGVIPGEL